MTRSIRLIPLALALLMLGLAMPAQAATGDSAPVLVPEVAVTGESIWIGYNVCSVAVLGEPEPCTGPHKLAEIPLGTDPCAFYGGMLCQPVPEPCEAAPNAPVLCKPAPQPCDVAPTAPGVCQPVPKPCEEAPTAPVLCAPAPCKASSVVDFCDGNCKVASMDTCSGDCTLGNIDVCDPDACDFNDNLPFTCGNDECPTLRPVPGQCGTPPADTCVVLRLVPGFCGTPDVEPCEEVPTAPVLCAPAPCKVSSVVDVCNGRCKVGNMDTCSGDCTLGNIDVCDPDACDFNDNLPFTCGNDECPTLRPVPGQCGTPPADTCLVLRLVPGQCGTEPLDPCNPVGSVRPCDVDPFIVVVDGELCAYRQSLSGDEKEQLFCVPV